MTDFRPEMNVNTFFDSLTDDYSQTIQRCFPRYPEMLWAVVNYLPRDRQFHSILELGCGTGNLSVLIKRQYPNAKFHLVDVSADSLQTCQSQLRNEKDFQRNSFECADFATISYPGNHFDLVVSSIAIHHIQSDAKRNLFRRTQHWLQPNGILCFSDQFAGVSPAIYDQHMSDWKRESFAAGATQQEWRMWMDHQTQHDHHDTLLDQMDWLRDAGFPKVDCVWRYLLWSVILASAD